MNAGRLLANQEYINRTQVEIIVEWKSSETIVAGVHTSIELRKTVLEEVRS